MNTETYDQVSLPRKLIEDVAQFLTPNMEVEVEFQDSTPLNVSVPKTVNLKVVATDPGVKTAAVTNTLKPATTEPGLVLQLPHFFSHRPPITIHTQPRES